MFCIHVLYPMYDLQIFCPFTLLTVSFVVFTPLICLFFIQQYVINVLLYYSFITSLFKSYKLFHYDTCIIQCIIVG